MRNVFEYPLTEQETLDTLERAQKAYTDKMSFGGIDGYALRKLVEFLQVETNMQEFINFAKQKRE